MPSLNPPPQIIPPNFTGQDRRFLTDLVRSVYQLFYNMGGTTNALQVPSVTTTERDAIKANNGMIVYNTTTNAFNFFEAGVWKSGSGLT